MEGPSFEEELLEAPRQEALTLSLGQVTCEGGFPHALLSTGAPCSYCGAAV